MFLFLITILFSIILSINLLFIYSYCLFSWSFNSFIHTVFLTFIVTSHCPHQNCLLYQSKAIDSHFLFMFSLLFVFLLPLSTFIMPSYTPLKLIQTSVNLLTNIRSSFIITHIFMLILFS